MHTTSEKAMSIKKSANVEHVEEDVEAGFRDSSIPVSGTKRTWIECKDVDYQIGKAKILHGLNLTFPPGKLVALMGPSGSGKSTTLNMISHRGGGKRTNGSLTTNGAPITRKLMKRETKLVPQHDILQPVLTARETLEYTAKLSMNASASERARKVDEVLQQLSLESCADVFVGDAERKGLSGGQRKRVSIACELLSDPSCLFLDEPTSGLDSKVAEDVVDLIKALARGGRTVVCTIHQPSFQVFAKFDWLVMLDKGRVAYNGEVSKLSQYLLEIEKPCPTYVNPADHFMNVLSEPLPDDRYKNFEELFNSTSFKEYATSEIEDQRQRCDAYVANRLKTRTSSDEKTKKKDTSLNTYPTGFFTQFFTILRRAFYITIKDKAQMRTRTAQLLFIGLIVSTIFWFMEKTQSRAQEKLGVMFLILLFLGMSSIMSTALAMPIEKAVLAREFGNGYYSGSAYYFARIFVLLFFQTLYSTMFGSVVYFLIGLNPTAVNYFTFICCLILISLISGTVGYCAGIAFPTVQAAAAMVPSLVMPLAIFAGLFIPKPSIPDFWLFLWYLSFFQYALQIMTVNEFKDRDFDPCTTEQVLNPKLGLCPYGPCSNNPLEPQPCPGTVVLERLDYSTDDLGMNFGILIAFWAGFTMLGFLLLRRLLKKIQ